jgi:hypothetical protein
MSNWQNRGCTIDAFSLDAPNKTLSASELEQSTDLHQAAASSERAEIARLRSEKTKANGRKLAEAAIAGMLHIAGPTVNYRP